MKQGPGVATYGESTKNFSWSTTIGVSGIGTPEDYTALVKNLNWPSRPGHLLQQGGKNEHKHAGKP